MALEVLSSDMTEELESELIIEHYKHPRCYGLLVNASEKAQKTNPLCGDVITMNIVFDEGVLKEIGFTGKGCALSIAAASMVSELVKGKTPEEIENLRKIFQDAVSGDGVDSSELDSLGDLVVLTGVKAFPARTKCVMLPWEAVGEVLSRRL